MRKLVFSFALTALVACTSTDDPVDVSVQGGLAPKIINGTASPAAQDAAVMLYFLDSADNRLGGICTATLVAPNLVLTARHCVADIDDKNGVGCDSDGTPLFGGAIEGRHNPQDLYVFTGPNRPAFAGDAPPALDTTKWQPAGRGQQIIDDNSNNICNHDIAFVLLEAPITNVPIASMQLDGEPAVNEKVVTVGWGVTQAEDEPAIRQQRTNVSITRDGPSDFQPILAPSEILYNESQCEGDSGGPIYVEATGALLGVISRGSNGEDPSQVGFAASCVQADNIGTKLSAFKTFITDTFKVAGATPKITAAPDSGGGCSVGARSSPSNGVLIGLALALTLARRPKKRPASAS